MPDPARLAVPGFTAVAALLLTACGTAGAGSAPSGRGKAVTVTATDTACRVGTTELPAGTSAFRVTNSGSKVTEFYVYAAGDRIVGEVENIAPGVSRDLTVELAAGRYEAACKPAMVGDGVRTPLTVTGTATGLSADGQLSAAVTGYTGYVGTQVAALQDRTRQFAAAVKGGDVAAARTLYPVARSSYERIEPVAESFGDLDPQIDARENDVEEGGAWTGFHVLEKALWTGGDLAGAGPVADQLVRDVDDLAARAQHLDLAPLDLANGALGLLDEIATSKVTGEEDRYSHTDLWDLSANLEGSQQAVQSLRPVLAERDPALATALDARFAAARTALDAYRQGDGWVTYTDLTQEQTRRLSDAVNALAAQVSKVPAVIAEG